MFKNNVFRYIFISLTILIAFILIILSVIWLMYGNYFKVNEWVNLCVTLITTLLGAYATIIAVLISIDYSNKQREKEKKEKIKRINRIIYSEISACIFFIQKYFYEYIRFIELKGNNENINDNFTVIFYDVKSDLKDFIYEAMVYYDNKELIEIKNLYDTYIKCTHKFEQTGRIDDLISLAINYILSEECHDVLLNTYTGTKEMIIKDGKEISIYEHLNQEQLNILSAFLKKYYKDKKKIKLKEEIEEALEFLKGEIEN